jgi:hypothetical protein
VLETNTGTAAVLRDEIDPSGLKGALDNVHCRPLWRRFFVFEISHRDDAHSRCRSEFVLIPIQ